jgi:outer membrane protein TolC
MFRRFRYSSAFAACFLSLLGFHGVSVALTLKESLVQALKTSEEVTVSHEEVKRARLDPYRALTTVLPKVDYNLDYLHSRVEAARSAAGRGQTLGEIGGASNHSSQGEILLTERLIDFSLPVLLARAKHTIKGSLADLFYVSQEYLFRVVSGYYNVLKSQRIVEINEEFLRQTKEHLDVARVRLEVGEVIKTDVLRAEVDYATAQRNLIQAHNNLDLTKESLARYLHRPKEELKLVHPVTVLKPPMPVEDLLRMTYMARADLKSYEEAVYAARNDKQRVYTRFLPYMDIQANWATFGSTPYPHERDNWSVYGVVTVPILEGGLRFVDLRDTTASLIQATQRYLALKRDIDYAVKEAFLSIVTLEKTIAASMAEVEASSSNLELINGQYKVGLADAIDVTDAQTTYLNAQINLANDTFDHEVAVYNLKRVIGLSLLEAGWHLPKNSEAHFKKWYEYLIALASSRG